MATEFPEGEKPEAQDPAKAPDPASVDPGNVPLLPPGEMQPIPGRLETAPDGSIRPAAPDPQLDPSAPLAPGLGDSPPIGQSGPEFAPPAPGLIEEAELNPPDIGPAASEAPSWALGDDAPAAAPSEASAAERAAWPTVEPDQAAGAAPAPVTPPAIGDVPAPPLDTPVIEHASVPTPTAEQPAPEQQAPQQPPPAAPEQPAAPDQPPAAEYPSAPEPPAHGEPMTMRTPEEASGAEEMYDVPLGTLVYRSGLLSADQIESALAESERIGKRLGEVLIDSEMIDERDLGRLLAGQKGLPFLDLGQMEIDPAAAELLPAASARIYCALPIGIEQGMPVVAVSDPTNGLVVEGVRRAMGGELSFAVATRSDLQNAIAKSYGDDAQAATGVEAGAEPITPAAPEIAAEPPPMAAEPELATGTVDAAPAGEPAALVPEHEHAGLEPVGAEPVELEPVEPQPAPEEPAEEVTQEPIAPGPPAFETVPELEVPEAPAASAHPEIESITPPHDEPTITPEEHMAPSQPDFAAETPLVEPPHAETAHAETPLAKPADALAAPTPVEPAQPAPLTPSIGEPEPGHVDAASAKTVRVMIRLNDGDKVDAGSFETEAHAIERARELIGSIEGENGTGWPFLDGRFLRPETIVSIDLLEELPSKY